MVGLRVMLLHPEVGQRSCEECQTYLYDDRPERMAAKPVMRGGNKVERIPLLQLPLCRYCPKIPPGEAAKPANAVELSDRNKAAYVHYRRCKATMRFPHDPIVERNAAIILAVEEDAAAERVKLAQLETLTVLMAPALKR